YNKRAKFGEIHGSNNPVFEFRERKKSSPKETVSVCLCVCVCVCSCSFRGHPLSASQKAGSLGSDGGSSSQSTVSCGAAGISHSFTVALNAYIERGIRLRQERALEQWTHTRMDALDSSSSQPPLGPQLSSAISRWILYGTVVPSVHVTPNGTHRHHHHHQYATHSVASHYHRPLVRKPSYRRKMSST
ncbi:AGAP011714-PA, partial [Anopheles gambiae str. PEST]